MSRYELYAQRFPLLPLKNVVIFPRNIVTLLVGRPRSIQAVEEALSREKRIVVTAHLDSEIEDPQPEDLHAVGSLAEIISVERQQGGAIQVVLQGVTRVRLTSFDQSRQFYTVTADELKEPEPTPEEAQVMIQHVQELSGKYAEARGKLSTEVLDMIQRGTEPGHLADLLATQLLTDTDRRQDLLELVNPITRLEQLAIHMASEIEVAELEQ